VNAYSQGKPKPGIKTLITVLVKKASSVAGLATSGFRNPGMPNQSGVVK